MKRTLLITVFAFIVAIAFNNAAAQTSGSCGPNVVWQLTGSENELTLTISGKGEMDDNNRPWDFCKDEITTIIISEGVTKIGESVFQNFRKLKSVVISNSVIDIGKINFTDCPDLVSVEIGNSVELIGDWAFFCSGLTSLTIPNSVKSIGNYAFSICVNLKSATLGNSLVEIKDNSFGFCVNLDTIIFKTKTPFELGKFAFSYRQNACVFVPAGSLSDYIDSDWSSLFTNFIESNETGLNKNILTEKILFYPNPAKEKIFIDCEKFDFIKIYDMSGKEVISRKAGDNREININNLPKGIYNISVLLENKVIGNGKIIKH